jgi:hypothetical protein
MNKTPQEPSMNTVQAVRDVALAAYLIHELKKDGVPVSKELQNKIYAIVEKYKDTKSANGFKEYVSEASRPKKNFVQAAIAFLTPRR